MVMNPLASARFARQVGFGLAPDEATPDDPLAWAQAQLDKAPPVTFWADRTGALMTGLPEGLRLLDSQKDATLAMQGHWDAEKNSFEQSRQLPRPEWEKLRYETVDLPYWRMAPWQEVLARGAMAVNGPAPVFERFWHFWTNHFTVAPATKGVPIVRSAPLPTANTWSITISWPTSAAICSTLIFSPVATLNCLPPVFMSAYICAFFVCNKYFRTRATCRRNGSFPTAESRRNLRV